MGLPRCIIGLICLAGIQSVIGAPIEQAPVPLCNGESLDSWVVNGGTAQYTLDGDTIVGTTVEGSKNTFLCKGPFQDFELEFDVLCDPELNSGVQIRSHVYAQDTPQASKPDRIRQAGEVYGYQCEIAKGELGVCGNFWDEARRTRWLDDFSDRPAAQRAFKDNQWNRYRIVAQGDRIRSWVNGIACADFRDDTDARGFVGFQVHSIRKGTGPYQVRWRNIGIQPLMPEGDGTRSLFNGRDLTGWRVPEGDNGHWRVVNGVIDYDSLSEAPGNKSLWTEQEYGDCELHVEWRLKRTEGLYPMRTILPDGSYKTDAQGKIITTPTPNADSGILLRSNSQANLWCWPVGSGELWSVRNDTSLSPEVRAAAVPKVKADNPVGQWNAMDITLKGDRVTIVLNGARVIDNAQMPGLPERGPFGLQHHGGRDKKTGKLGPACSLVQFRNLWIKELDD
jgi:hypothetical protein